MWRYAFNSGVVSVDERIHTLADRRMVISLMNGAFDQEVNGLLCQFSRAFWRFIINLSNIGDAGAYLKMREGQT